MTTFGETRAAAGSVLRAGDAEPDRAGRHLPAAGGAARSLHVQGGHRRRRSRGARGDPGHARPRRAAAARAGADGRASCTICSRWSTPCTCREAVANFIARLVAASHPSSADAPEAVRDVRQVRQLAARRDLHRRGGARAGAAARQARTSASTRCAGWRAPAMAHRLVLDYAARLEGWDGRRVVAALLDGVPEIERGLPQTLEARCREPASLATARLRTVDRLLVVLRRLHAAARGCRRAPRANTAPSKSSRSEITIDSEWALANRARLPAGQLRHHEPRRGAGHRDRRPGHAVLRSVTRIRAGRHRGPAGGPPRARRPRAADDSDADLRRQREHPVRDPRRRPHARALQLHRVPERRRRGRRRGADRAPDPLEHVRQRFAQTWPRTAAAPARPVG